MRWGDFLWDNASIGWVLYAGGRSQAAIYDPDNANNEDRGPKWTTRVRMNDHVETVHLDPSLTLDEVKAVVQTLAGAQA